MIIKNSSLLKTKCLLYKKCEANRKYDEIIFEIFFFRLEFVALFVFCQMIKRLVTKLDRFTCSCVTSKRCGIQRIDRTDIFRHSESILLNVLCQKYVSKHIKMSKSLLFVKRLTSLPRNLSLPKAISPLVLRCCRMLQANTSTVPTEDSVHTFQCQLYMFKLLNLTCLQQ